MHVGQWSSNLTKFTINIISIYVSIFFYKFSQSLNSLIFEKRQLYFFLEPQREFFFFEFTKGVLKLVRAEGL